MRLNNSIRQAFVSSVMNDVPSIDYEEKARSLINKKAAAILAKAGLDKVDSTRLRHTTVYAYKNGRRYYNLVSAAVFGLSTDEVKSIESSADLIELAVLNETQEKTNSELRRTIQGAINACTTRKQAVEALPEFEKYLPEDEAKAMRSVPVIANVVSDFVKSGWPKGQKRIVKTQAPVLLATTQP